MEETEKDPEALKKKAFLKAVCDDAVWYDFNDSTVKRMSSGHEVAAQYGGPRQRESAYMLIYRKVNKETAREIMGNPDVSLPDDLKEFADAANRKMEEERKRKEEEENALTLQIVHPNCFEAVDGGKKLTMRPFIESLLKKMLRFARDKKKVEENEPILDDDENENKKIEQFCCFEMFLEKCSKC